MVTSTFNFVDQPPVITVVLPDGQRHVAKLWGRDESRRICMLKIDGVTDLPVPSYAKPAELRIGQWAVSVGVGYGDFEPAISAGMIGALNRIFGRAVQTDANISPANYGGPLLDIEGRVIGICVPLQPQSDEQAAGAQWYDSGIGFAVPFADLSEIMAAMKSGKTLRRAGLNLKLEPAKEGGVTIVEVPEKSAAAEGGLAKGDRIVAIDAAAIREARDFQRTVSRYVAEQNVRLSLVRDGNPVHVTVRLEAASAISPPAGERLKGSAP